MKVIKRLAFILLAMAVIVPLAWGERTKEGGAEEEGYHFILINNMVSLNNFYPDYEGAQLACDEIYGATGDKVTFEVVGPAENDLLKTVEAMEAAIAKRPDGFMVVVWDINILSAPINKAVDAGIPVVCIDGDAPGSKRLAFVGTDWYELGVELGKAMAREINGEGKVAMLGLIGSAMENAYDGFRDVMAGYPKVQIVALENDRAQETEAARIAADLMTAHPDLAGFAGFDAASAPGIATAVREAGKKGIIKVVGNDVNTAQLQALNEGTVQFVLGQRRKFFGYWGVMMLYNSLKTNLNFSSDDMAAGVTNVPPFVITGFIYVTKENAEYFWDEFEKYSKQKFIWGAKPK